MIYFYTDVIILAVECHIIKCYPYYILDIHNEYSFLIYNLLLILHFTSFLIFKYYCHFMIWLLNNNHENKYILSYNNNQIINYQTIINI
jgi:hypothetical protein